MISDVLILQQADLADELRGRTRAIKRMLHALVQLDEALGHNLHPAQVLLTEIEARADDVSQHLRALVRVEGV